ncbi:helix-turn-helix domain-containing protein [Alcaligenaceae bacterium B3P038]|nr:helix-turn-helix domain-containing protein [Alcaligenaceae bacterium B3P038]
MTALSRQELAPLYARPVFQSTHADDARRRVSDALKDHRVRWRPGAVDAALYRGRLGALTVCALRYGAEVSIDPDRLKDFMLVQVPLAGRADIECGGIRVAAHASCAVVIAPSQPVRLHWEAGCEQLMLKIPRERLEDVAAQSFGRPMQTALSFEPAMPLDTPVGAAWRGMMTGLVNLLPLLNDGAAPQGAWLARFEEALILHLVHHQPNSWMREIGTSPTNAPRRLAAAEDYMRQRLCEPLTLAEIAAHVGLSISALSRLFQVHRGTTPMNDLRRLRLEAAHARLRRDAGANVTEVAMAFGFFHLGRFAEYYRQRFGELPSDTARR